MIRLVFISCFVCHPLALRIGRRVFSVLTLRADSTALTERAYHRRIPIISLTLDVLCPLCTISALMPAWSVIGMLLATFLTTHLRKVGSLSACLCIASSVRSRCVNGTLFLDIGLANFLFALDLQHVMPPRNSAPATRLGGSHPLDGLPPLTGHAGAAGVFALNSFP